VGFASALTSPTSPQPSSAHKGGEGATVASASPGMGNSVSVERFCLTAQQFGERLGGDGVRQDHRQAKRQQDLAMALGETDAIQQDRVGALCLQLLAGIDECVLRAAIGRGGGEDRRVVQGAPFAALGANLRSDRHDDSELPPLDETSDPTSQAFSQARPSKVPVHSSRIASQPSASSAASAVCTPSFMRWRDNMISVPS
jgi:hypothetical protein